MALRTSPKWVILVLLTQLVVATINPVYGAGYGEDSGALGQFVDDFIDLGNVSVAVGVVRNSTYDAMGINETTMAGGDENLLTWTEVDVEGDLVVTAPNVQYTTLRRDSDAMIYKDYGLNFFDDFMFNLTFNPDSMEAGDASNVASFWLMSVSTHNTRDGMVLDDSLVVEMRQQGANDNKHAYRIIQWIDGVNAWSINDPSFYNTPFTHYVSLYRSGATLGLRVYTDEARTNQIEHLTTGTGDQSKYQYANLAMGYSSVGDPADHATGDIYNVTFGGNTTGYVSGYFTTTDYLADPLANGSTLALMTTSRIFPNTHITVQMSDDNATWGDAGGVPGDSHDLVGGLETIDLRPFNESGFTYFMFNLSTTDPAFTPWLNQSRLITTIGNSTGDTVNVSSIWTYYDPTNISVTTGTLDDGNITHIIQVGGGSLNVSEVVGVPGMDISVNFTGIPASIDCVWLVLNSWYDGNAVHDFDIDVWNYTAPAWVNIGHIPDQVAFTWVNSTVYDLRIPADFLNGGEVRVRLYHMDAGNMNHDLFLDFIKLYAELPTDAGAGPGTTIDGVNWLPIALILGLAMVLLTSKARA